MSGLSPGQSPLTPLQTYQRILAVDPAAAAEYARTLGLLAHVGLAVVAAATAAEFARAARQPHPTRQFRDLYRTR